MMLHAKSLSNYRRLLLVESSIKTRLLCTARTNISLKNSGRVSTFSLSKEGIGRSFAIHDSENVGEVIKTIQGEFGENSKPSFTMNGIDLAEGTRFRNLLHSDFIIKVDGEEFHVKPEEEVRHVHSTLENVNRNVATLFQKLNPELLAKHEAEKEILEAEIAPLDQKIAVARERAIKYTEHKVWAGLTFMAVQWGFLARLTWWEFSWDLMEPVTYFITTGNAIFFYAMFAATKIDYDYVTAKGRHELGALYKWAHKEKIDINRYSTLKKLIADHEREIQRLKN